MIAVTGASGHLGRLVVKELLKTMPAREVVALARQASSVEDLRGLGVTTREADYDQPDTLVKAFEGVGKLLLVSSVIPGQRLGHHKAVIDSAKKAGVKAVAYTSLLRADSSTLNLAEEHKRSEDYLRESALEHVILRNGWYLENTTSALASAVQGTIVGCSGQGRYASASRADYAGAAAVVLTQPGHANKTYELAGDASFSMAEFAHEASCLTGSTVVYRDLPPDEYRAILIGAGMPPMFVDVLVDSGLKAARGELESYSRDLSRLLGRPTTPLPAAIQATLDQTR